MWAAIRSDLSEFVSGVAEETDHAIGTAAASAVKFNDEGEILGGGFEATGLVQSPQDEVVRLQGHIETFKEPLDESDESVQAFLDSFNIMDKTQEIAMILEQNPDTVKIHFETLVPTEISYEIFWQRYFYRCDPDRIQQEWDAEDEEDRKANASALAGGLKSLFGGAMAAVSKVVSSESRSVGEEVPVSPFGYNASTGVHSSGVGLNLFGSGGRPPFVLNTAVDEDDDEEDEEEELGWDDEDEEEIDEEETPSSMNVSEEITFTGGNNPEFDRLSEQLAQALSERDALKETIALQNKEIADLKNRKGDMSTSESDKTIERLKLSLFEKDSELAALKASLEDTHEDDTEDKSKKDAAKIAAMTKEVELLNQQVSDRDHELAAAKESADAAQSDLARIRETALGEQELLKSSLEIAKAETDSLRHELEALSKSSDAFELVKKKLDASLLTNTALHEELAKIQKDFTDAKQYATEMEQEVEVLKQRLAVFEGGQSRDAQPQVPHLPKATPPKEEERASPSSQSTGVKVEAIPKLPQGDAEDDWGDDWGDEDEE